jgi:hypothetical protein
VTSWECAWSAPRLSAHPAIIRMIAELIEQEPEACPRLPRGHSPVMVR